MRRVRRSKIQVVAALLVLAGLVVLGPLHFVLLEHDFCPEDGTVVRRSERGGGHAPHEGAPAAPGAPHDHREDACGVVLLLRAGGTLPLPLEVALLFVPAEPVVVSDTLEPVPPPVPLLALAPSHSPPLAA